MRSMRAGSLLPRLWAARAKDPRIAGSVVAAGAGIALAGSFAWARSGGVLAETGAAPGELSVMTWNVLARPYTEYNAKFHASGGKVEEPSQTVARYTLAGRRIVSQGADLVFLQECEANFFSAAWNGAADKVLEEYLVFSCRIEDNPGTAVLVKKSGSVATSASKPACIGGTREAGGCSKVATVLPVHAGARHFAAVSTHFTWDGAAEQRLHHAKLIGEGLTAQSIVLGGDFNCQPGEKLAKLESSTFLQDLQRAELPKATTTGLNSDFSQEECIDHVYASRDFSVRSAAALDGPRSPWVGSGGRPGKVEGASDHVPVFVKLGWR